MLAQPRVVEILENNFIPVAIYNNAGGYDQKILKQFNEPSWNYQVMRCLDADLKDLIPRKDKVWDVKGTLSRMAKALAASKASTKGSAELDADADQASSIKIAVFAMNCFWTGEAKLGSLDGVTETEAGFFDGREVVVVKYNDQEINLASLVGEAEKFDCASAVYLPDAADREWVKSKTRLRTVGDFDFKSGYRRAPESDQKRQLSSYKSMLQDLGLTPEQWTKLNSRGVSGTSVKKILTPSQYSNLKGKR